MDQPVENQEDLDNSSNIFQDAIFYKEIQRKNPDVLRQLFSEIKINQIEQYLAANSTVPTLQQMSESFQRDASRSVSRENSRNKSRESSVVSKEGSVRTSSPSRSREGSMEVEEQEDTSVSNRERKGDVADISISEGGESRGRKRAASITIIDNDDTDDNVTTAKVPQPTPAKKLALSNSKSSKSPKDAERERKKQEAAEKREKQRKEKEEKLKEKEELKRQKEEERQKKKEEVERKKKEEEDKRLAKRQEEEQRKAAKKAVLQEEEAKKFAKKQEEEQKRLAKLKEEEERKDQKRKEQEAAEEKKRRAAEKFINFFSKVEKKKAEEKPDDAVGDGMWYRPFQVKDGMVLSPILRREPLPEDFDLLSQNEKITTDYLKSSAVKERKLVASRKIPLRAKLFQFSDNYRPPYYGTWRKRSNTITGRRPFSRDDDLDYEYDSDDEWEAEPSDAEECKSDEEEDADGDIDEEDDGEEGFFVPPCYLSEGEGDNSESGSIEMLGMRRHKRDPFDSGSDEGKGESPDSESSTGAEAREQRRKGSSIADLPSSTAEVRDAEARKARLAARATEWSERHTTASAASGKVSQHQQQLQRFPLLATRVQGPHFLTPIQLLSATPNLPTINLGTNHPDTSTTKGHHHPPIATINTTSASDLNLTPAAPTNLSNSATHPHPTTGTGPHSHIPHTLSRLQAVVFAN